VSRPRFLADHDLNEAIIDGVLRRDPHIEFIRARSVGLAGRLDPEVLEYAAGDGLIIVSHDVNTMPAHATDRLARGDPIPGLIMIRQSLPLADAINNLTLIWSASESEEWAGLIVFLPL
jgi:predicted nuclease of predicted toxin-antitoxin system